MLKIWQTNNVDKQTILINKQGTQTMLINKQSIDMLTNKQVADSNMMQPTIDPTEYYTSKLNKTPLYHFDTDPNNKIIYNKL